MLDLLSSIQFGFDVATSLTIIITAFTWAYSQNKQNKEKLKKGLDENVRSASLRTVQNAIEALQPSNTKLMRSINVLWKLKYNLYVHAENEEEFKNAQVSIDEGITDIRNDMDEFLNIIKHHQYLLNPMLLSMESNQYFTIELNAFINRAEKLLSEQICYSHSLSEAIRHMQVLVKGTVEHGCKELAAYYKVDYGYFMDNSFTPRIEKQILNTFLGNEKSTVIIEDSPLSEIFPSENNEKIEFLLSLRDDPVKITLQYTEHMHEIYAAIRADILASLSAISGKLMCRVGDKTLKSWKEEINNPTADIVQVHFRVKNSFATENNAQWYVTIIWSFKWFLKLLAIAIVFSPAYVNAFLPKAISSSLAGSSYLEYVTYTVLFIINLVPFQLMLLSFVAFLIIFNFLLSKAQEKWFNEHDDANISLMCMTLNREKLSDKHPVKKEFKKLLKRTKRLDLLEQLD